MRSLVRRIDNGDFDECEKWCDKMSVHYKKVIKVQLTKEPEKYQE